MIVTFQTIKLDDHLQKWNPRYTNTGAANTPETPLPEIQKTCLRNSPCMQQGCLTCSTPTNHVRDLSDALDDVTPAGTIANTNASTIVPTKASRVQPASTNNSTNRPTVKLQPPPDHIIVHLTEMFQDALQDNNIFKLECTMNLYAQVFSSNPEFATYDRSALLTALNHAKQVLTLNSACRVLIFGARSSAISCTDS